MDLLRFYDSAFHHAVRPDKCEIIARVDLDDEQLGGYRELEAVLGPRQIPAFTLLVGPRDLCLSNLWNECWGAAHAQAEIFMMGADDLVFRSPRWDEMLREAFYLYPDRIAFVYGRDSIQNEALGTHGAIHKHWVDTVGYFVPPLFEADCNDSWLHEVSEIIGRKHFIPDLETEHLHASSGKSPRDATHDEQRARRVQFRIDEKWHSTAPLRRADAEKLQSFIKQQEAARGEELKRKYGSTPT